VISVPFWGSSFAGTSLPPCGSLQTWPDVCKSPKNLSRCRQIPADLAGPLPLEGRDGCGVV
jgi:hypothetical protein